MPLDTFCCNGGYDWSIYMLSPVCRMTSFQPDCIITCWVSTACGRVQPNRMHIHWIIFNVSGLLQAEDAYLWRVDIYWSVAETEEWEYSFTWIMGLNDVYKLAQALLPLEQIFSSNGVIPCSSTLLARFVNSSLQNRMYHLWGISDQNRLHRQILRTVFGAEFCSMLEAGFIKIFLNIRGI